MLYLNSCFMVILSGIPLHEEKDLKELQLPLKRELRRVWVKNTTGSRHSEDQVFGTPI